MMTRAETTTGRAVKIASVLSLALAVALVCGHSRSLADNLADDGANASLTRLDNMHLVRYLLVVGGDSVCSAHETDARTRPTPPALAPAVITAFAVSMPPAEAAANSVIRCADGQLLACVVGANLNCGKADTRTSSPDASGWCRDHPNSDFVPAAVTGHETIYTWRCDGTRAVIDRQVQHVDPQGFVAENWRRVRIHRDLDRAYSCTTASAPRTRGSCWENQPQSLHRAAASGADALPGLEAAAATLADTNDLSDTRIVYCADERHQTFIGSD